MARANTVVPHELIVDVLWGERPPVSAAANLKSHVADLRALIGPGPDGRRRPVSARGGYRLEVEPDELDVVAFDRLTTEGRALLRDGNAAAAAERLARALGLWRGRVLEGIELPEELAAEVARLDQLRLSAVEDSVEARLALGAPGELPGELEALVRAHPLRERLWEQLMRAQCRAGRPADALVTFQRVADLLDRELGARPGAALSGLRRRILRGDAGQAESGAATPVPRQLPADVTAFTGRGPELAGLDDRLATVGAPAPVRAAARAVVICAICGTPGVGKTALAVRWAHRNLDRFPDGQLYVDLRGYDPDQPLSPGAVLAGFLQALGIPAPAIPGDPDARAARYRTELAGRRMLVVLDNAASVEQIRPLLPGTGPAAVLVTSRDSLAGLVALHGAGRLRLDLLPAADAYTLLRRTIGPRVAAEPAAAADLADRCARMPLALRVAAELAASRPDSTLRELTAELGDEGHRLLWPDTGDPRAAVGAVFSWSVRHLPDFAADAFGRLGLHPGASFDGYATGALSGTDPLVAERALDLLARAHLVQPTPGGRYAMHDLLRAYARSLAAGLPVEDVRDARTRLADHYLAVACAAMDRLYPGESHRRPRVPAPPGRVPALPDGDAARSWLDAERAALVAVAGYGASGHATGLSTTLSRYLQGGYPVEALAVHSGARDAARRAGDRTAEARARIGIGNTYSTMGRYRSAVEEFQSALTLFRQTGEPTGEAWALTNLGIVERRLGRYRPAADHHAQAVALFDRIGEQTGEADALTNLGVVETQLGRTAQAGDHFRRALALARRAGDRTGEAHTLDNLGTLHNSLGEPEQAAEYHRQALHLFEGSGDQDGEGWALNGLGEAASAAGDPAGAIAYHEAALAVAVHTSGPAQQARAHAGLGRAYTALGDHPDRAREHLTQALAIYTSVDSPEAATVRAQLAAT